MKVAINRCWGGFGLSHQAIMRYAELKGIKLYAFVEKRDVNGRLDFKHFVPYKGQSDEFVVHYATQPLQEDGTYIEDSYFSTLDFERNDSTLIKVIEELGDKANGNCAKIVIRDIPDGIEWEIDDYDGMEKIEESHRSW
jgi:hypothetical protein